MDAFGQAASVRLLEVPTFSGNGDDGHCIHIPMSELLLSGEIASSSSQPNILAVDEPIDFLRIDKFPS